MYSISLVRDFMGYALAVEVFRDIIYRNNPMAFSTLRINGLSIHCPLGHVADALIALTNGVAELDQVVLCKGRVLNVDMNPVVNPASPSRNPCTDYVDFTVDCDGPASRCRYNPVY